MDISKASNFERFIFDLTERNAMRIKELWQSIDKGNAFDLFGTALWVKAKDFGFVSGTSHHAARIDMIHKLYHEYKVLVDTHTADGVKVGLEYREPGVPLICLETALPTKFAESIKEAVGFEPTRPAGFENLEDLPQRFEVMDNNVDAIKTFISQKIEQI
jgi:threonine synthase